MGPMYAREISKVWMSGLFGSFNAPGTLVGNTYLSENRESVTADVIMCVYL